MDGNDNEEETYIEHLRSMFNELDPEGKGGLDRKELTILSEKLSLMKNQSDLLLQLSFSNEEDVPVNALEKDGSKECVSFNKFQESFVAVLSATTDAPASESDEEEVQDAGTKLEEESVSEMMPRVVRGSKTYGRRSQPDIFDAPIRTEESGNQHFISKLDDETEASDPEDVFPNGFYELPEGGGGDGLYFEASGLLRNPLLDRLRPKSTSTTLNESQLNLSCASLMLQTQHLFTELDKNDLGFIAFADLREMWTSEGVAKPKHVLQLLDVSIDTDKQVNAYDLTSALENEATSLRLSTADSVAQAILATYKHQLAYMNGQIEQHQALIGKMKEDLDKSELRNSKLIDEIDDRYLHVDKSREKILSEAERNWTQKLRQTKRNFSKDCELLQTQAMLERDALQQEIERLTIREGSLRSTIDALQMDNDALEQETKELSQKLQISQSEAARLQNDLEQLIREKANSSNDSFSPSQEERFAAIVKDYEAQCRALQDRNDELVAELERARSEFLQSVRKKPGDRDVDGNSNSRKRARRRASMEYIDKPGRQSSDESDMDGDELRVELCSKISDMEKTIQKLEEEKTALATRFTEEKAALRNQLESEFQDKLREEREKAISFKEMTKSEKNTAINQALADGKKQREELEKRVQELKKALEAEQLNTQKSITDLCREFENDKAEIQSKNEELVLELRQDVSDLQVQLEKEVEAHETTSQQLRADRSQHKAAMQAHSEAIGKLEEGARGGDEARRLAGRLRQLEEEVARSEAEKRKIVADHEVALDLAKAEMQQKIEEIIVDKRKQERSSLCLEMERMHDNVVDERKRMQERIATLKEAFDAEAEELRTLVEVEKCELRRTLADESEALRKKLADENEKAVAKKRRELEEEERGQRESRTKHFEEIISNLQAAKADLEEELRHSAEEIVELEKRVSSLEREKENASSASHLQQIVDEKDKMNTTLQSQMTDLRMKHLETTQELAKAKTRCDAKSAEIAQIVKEKQEYADMIVSLENEKSKFQVENAKLLSRNIELGKSEADELAAVHEKEIAELRSKLDQQSTACEELREKLKSSESQEDVSSNGAKRTTQADMKAKFDRARQQLIQQMQKTKEMYSKLGRSEALIKDLYCENAELMRSLQLTEDRYKSSEREIMIQVDKNASLTNLLRKMCPEAV